jgi:hypothetical protein
MNSFPLLKSGDLGSLTIRVRIAGNDDHVRGSGSAFIADPPMSSLIHPSLFLVPVPRSLPSLFLFYRVKGFVSQGYRRGTGRGGAKTMLCCFHYYSRLHPHPHPHPQPLTYCTEHDATLQLLSGGITGSSAQCRLLRLVLISGDASGSALFTDFLLVLASPNLALVLWVFSAFRICDT